LENLLVNAMAQVGRIEAKIQIEQVSLSFQRSIFAFHRPLIRCSGGIILANDLVANVLFVDEFECFLQVKKCPFY